MQGRNRGVERDADTENGEREARDVKATRDGATEVGEKMVGMERTGRLRRKQRQRRGRESRGMNWPKVMGQQEWQQIGSSGGET